MIVENEREENLPYVYDNPAPTETYRGPAGDLETCTARHQAVRSTQRHLQLKTDLFIRDGSVEYPEFRANSQVVPSLMFSSVNKFMSVVVRHDLPCFLQGCDGGGAGTMSEHARRGRLVSDAREGKIGAEVTEKALMIGVIGSLGILIFSMFARRAALAFASIFLR
ncbi:hypothetical protein PR002_g24147 [Phytophthora rubi]|uniref:Uncharacterized protein n=1 Tax=Phytophthora rubi TaxID=129364 RepID=A0A6A3IIK9_9STRA|nr:hypothetical protein PR002_g24147 [Phytophthora rubi]